MLHHVFVDPFTVEYMGMVRDIGIEIEVGATRSGGTDQLGILSIFFWFFKYKIYGFTLVNGFNLMHFN